MTGIEKLKKANAVTVLKKGEPQTRQLNLTSQKTSGTSQQPVVSACKELHHS